MKIEETEDAEKIFGDPLSKGIVIFPENMKELNAINYVLNHKRDALQTFIKTQENYEKN